MKKSGFSLSRFFLEIAFLMAIFSISNGCTKIPEGNSYPFDPNQSTGKYDVTAGISSFSPSEITVEVGSEVTWHNTNALAYPPMLSVTSSDGLFDGIISHGQSYTYKFLSAGIYSYFNRMKPSITGKVIVK